MEASIGALALLSSYGGEDSSGDEVPFGRVSTKRCRKDTEEDGCAVTKRRIKKLRLPSIIKATKDEHVEDPSMHEGRIRSFPHERDNWATYVYIPYELNDGVQHLINNITLHVKDFRVVNDFHISLTKVVVLRHHWINSFVTTVKESIGHFRCFIVMFDSLEVYCNEERTRTFIGLEIKTGFDTLSKLVSVLDGCLEEYRLPKFYEERRFHMSLVWCTGDHEETVRTILPTLNEHLREIINNYSDDNWYIYVNKLLCKVGNKYFTFCIT